MSPEELYDAIQSVPLDHVPMPLEIEVRWDHDRGAQMTYWAFDVADAQVLMELFRKYAKEIDRSHQIRWRDWSKPNEHTKKPIWVMFPW